MRSDIDHTVRGDKESLIIDAGIISSIITLLAAIQLGLPASLHDRLAFDHDAFVPWTLLTSAYVHHDHIHLLNNLTGFVVAATIVYWLCWRLNARQWFRVTTLSFLPALAILVNLTSYVVLKFLVPNASPVGRGFSGVAAGFVGFLFAAFVIWATKRFSRNLAIYLGEGVVVIMAWVLALIYGGLEFRVMGLAAIGIGLSGWGIINELNNLKTRIQGREWLFELQLSISIVLLLVGFLIAMFPANLENGEMTTNIFAHGAGFIWGTIIALVLWRVH